MVLAKNRPITLMGLILLFAVCLIFLRLTVLGFVPWFYALAPAAVWTVIRIYLGIRQAYGPQLN